MEDIKRKFITISFDCFLVSLFEVAMSLDLRYYNEC
jgi:hypothetical protein